MKNYKVTFKYTGKVTVEVEAEDEEQAEELGIEQADEFIGMNLSIDDVRIQEIRDSHGDQQRRGH